VIRVNPKVPLDLWLAVGICYYKLGNITKARFAIEHVVENEAQNAFAVTCLAVIEQQLNPSSEEQRVKALTLLHKSFDLDDTNPLTMKYLANHYFFQGDLSVAQQLCERALHYLNL